MSDIDCIFALSFVKLSVDPCPFSVEFAMARFNAVIIRSVSVSGGKNSRVFKLRMTIPTSLLTSPRADPMRA